jgi:hypothetical protein
MTANKGTSVTGTMKAKDRLPGFQATFRMEVAGCASMTSSPPRPRKTQLHIARMRPDQLSEQVTNFGNGERKQWFGLLGGIERSLRDDGRRRRFILCTNPSQEGVRKHDKCDMAIPPDPTADLVMVKSHVFGVFKIFFNGTITNDKFCLSRTSHLHLSWWRLPRCSRLPATQQTVYPDETHEWECASQEDRYEDTSVEHPASRRPNSRRATEVGSSVSESDPMESRGSAGPFAGSASTGEKR